MEQIHLKSLESQGEKNSHPTEAKNSNLTSFIKASITGMLPQRTPCPKFVTTQLIWVKDKYIVLVGIIQKTDIWIMLVLNRLEGFISKDQGFFCQK